MRRGGVSTPRHSPYIIELTREEQTTLEARARKYTSPYRDVVRAKVVLVAAKARQRFIAARLNTPRQIVSKWRNRFFYDRLPGLEEAPEAGAQPAFPPSVVVDVKRLACELPSQCDVPLARFTIPELHPEVLARGLVAQISGVTFWRWLSADALQPWRHRSCIFPRDPSSRRKPAGS